MVFCDHYGNPPFDVDVDPYEDCPHCDYKKDELHAGIQHFKGIWSQLTGNQPVDIKTLYHDLRELGDILEINIPNDQITIARH